nr:MAG TPA: hypothetical protein [Caudoviricetes sp.]
MDKRLEIINKLYQGYIIPEIEKERFPELVEDGALFYMNGKNGTMFDVAENHHLPALSTFYVEGEYAFSRMFIENNNTAGIYFYKKGELSPYKEVTVELNDLNFSELADLLYSTDLRGIWDENVNRILKEGE